MKVFSPKSRNTINQWLPVQYVSLEANWGQEFPSPRAWRWGRGAHQRLSSLICTITGWCLHTYSQCVWLYTCSTNVYDSLWLTHIHTPPVITPDTVHVDNTEALCVGLADAYVCASVGECVSRKGRVTHTVDVYLWSDKADSVFTHTHTKVDTKAVGYRASSCSIKVVILR